MLPFFHCWRRKAGCVTLVMSCVCMAAWVRSLSTKDEVSLRQNIGVTHHLISNHSRFAWKTVTIDDPVSTNFLITFYFSELAKDDGFCFYRGPDPQWIWRREWCGFEFGEFRPNGPPWTEEIWVIPYWSVVVPLTLISAWLLLSKPWQKPIEVQPRATTK